MNKIIGSFSDKYRFLSNHYPCEVRWGGHEFTSSEHAFMAAKCVYVKDILLIQAAPTPGEAKRLGRTITLRKNWDNIKLEAMYDVVFDKFSRNKDIQKLLLDTGCATLIEGNTWNDTYWGMCNGKGENHLGKILMRVRDRLEYQLGE
jgi:ribA/ribD-fused uncharacterized protein